MASGNEGVTEKKVFRPTTPHCFKIILQQTLDDVKLVLPKRFVRICGTDFLDSVLLKVPSGDEWRVELFRSEDDVYFRNGWGGFVKHYSVALGHFVVFKESLFCLNVLIFDTSATEIDYPILVNEKSKDDAVKEADDFELALPSNNVKAAIPCERNGRGVSAEISAVNYRAKTMAFGNGRITERKVFKPTTPRFFKIILQQALDDAKLVLPKTFVMICGTDFSDSVLLKVPSGDEWQVELFRSEDDVYFRNGWGEFVKHYSLAHGHFVVFECKSSSCFDVIIFDKSATEIEYPILVNEKSKDDILKETDDVELALPSEDVNSKLPRPKNRSSAASENTRPSNIEASDGRNPKLPRVRRTFAGDRDIPASKGNLHKVTEMSRKLSKKERIRALKRAKASFNSNNPNFMVLMQASYIVGSQLFIPFKFMERHFTEKVGKVSLKVSGQGTWTVDFSIHDAKRLASIRSNWRAFVQDNNLKLGDVCIFELIRGAELTFKVRISRANEGATSGIPADKSQQLKKHGDVEAANTYTSSNPFFKAEIQYYVLQNVPAVFMKHIMDGADKIEKNKRTVPVSLQFADRRWPIEIFLRTNSSSGRLGAGWAKFTRDNSIQAGDICIFELIETDPSIILRVLKF